MADKTFFYEWWKNTPGPRNFLQEVTKTAMSGKSAVIDLRSEDLENFLRVFSDEMSLRNLSPSVEIMNTDEESTETIFDLITQKFALRYRRDFSIEPFQDLAEQDGIQGAIIFIPVSDADVVSDMIDDYNSVEKNTIGSIFYVARNIRPSLSTKKILVNEYMSPIDSQFFAMRILQDVNLTPMQRWYSALIATKIAMNISMSESLLEKICTPDLYFDTKNFVHRILESSNLLRMKNLQTKLNFDTFFERITWETQIQLVLPIVERVREEVIERNEDLLRSLLPIRDEFGNVMDKPLDMEFRNLKYHVSQGFSYDDQNLVETMYNVRNELSHLKILSLEKLEEVLKLAQ